MEVLVLVKFFFITPEHPIDSSPTKKYESDHKQPTFYENWFVANVLDYDHEICEFDLWPGYYIHFHTNAFRKSINPFIHPGMG